MTVRLERAIRSIEGVARVHINRWGDGSAHLHLWFLARPYGRLQLRGTFLSLWDDILPPIAEPEWRENLALVAAWLAEFGGRPLAEPPPLDWKAPTTLDDRAESTVEGPVQADSPPAERPAPAVDWDSEDVVHVPAEYPPADTVVGEGRGVEDPKEAVGTPEAAPDEARTTAAEGVEGDGAGPGDPAAQPEDDRATAAEEAPNEAPAPEPPTADAPGPDAPATAEVLAPGATAVPTRRRTKTTASGQRSNRGGRRPLAPDPADPEEAWEEGV
jgi:hypothetical protein